MRILIILFCLYVPAHAGAKCEGERAEGYEAKAFMAELARNCEIKIENDYGEDRYGRLVVELSANGADLAAAGVRSGHLERWSFKEASALAPKPDRSP